MNKEIAPNLETKFLESITFEQSEFSSMTNEQLDYEFERLKYILSKFEINQFIQLSSEKAKQRAIFQYWKVRDPDTNTRVNERLEEYNRATTYANTYFSFSSSDDGWKTDRGRILMKYGFPSEKKTFLPRNRQKTTEEWLYPSIQGGAYFYFVDVKENSNLQLVHSSAINEVRNDTWIYDYNAAYDENDPKFINQLKSEEVRRKSR